MSFIGDFPDFQIFEKDLTFYHYYLVDEALAGIPVVQFSISSNLIIFRQKQYILVKAKLSYFKLKSCGVGRGGWDEGSSFLESTYILSRILSNIINLSITRFFTFPPRDQGGK